MKGLSRLLARWKSASTSGSSRDVAARIDQALSAAGLDRAGHQAAVRATIDRALADAGLREAAAPSPRVSNAVAPSAGAVEQRAVDVGGRGQFLHASYASAHGRRDYRLYLPGGYDPAGPAQPLVVMLHGCTQSAEDFAVGTRMNAWADRHGFLVAYPQQAGKANHAKCWNWFRPEDQRGDAGEPAVLAGLAQQVARDHRVDPRRIFVAGLSAGAAMAVILGRTRPDVVRAVGVHSGLPYASAHDVPSAFATMQGRGGGPAHSAGPGMPAVPTILFHGDADRTVSPSNADAIAAASMPRGARAERQSGRADGGATYTRDVVADATGMRCFERWTVHGAGHAWSGGDPAGSYTDPTGPDASAAMVEFFLRFT